MNSVKRARKRFGQHFLARPSIVSRIVRGARVEEGDEVLEIGPGLGSEHRTVFVDVAWAAG